MSPSKSGLEPIRLAAERAREVDPDPSDPVLRTILQTATGHPTLVHHRDGTPAFWIVPFLQGDLAAGFARVELDEQVTQLAAFGSGDPRSWVPATFFKRPPEGLLREITRKHPSARIEDAIFTYEKSPVHWGWRLEFPSGGAAFMTPHEWHLERSLELDDYEG